jgi:hypothetical protein
MIVCGVFILKIFHKHKSEKLPQKFVKIPFSFLHYKITRALRILL